MIPAILAPMIGEGLRETLGRVLDRVLPDPELRAKADAEVRAMEREGTFEQRAEQETRRSQIDVLKADAAGKSAMQRLWRPFMGWACGVSLAYCWIVHPMVSWVAALNGWPAPPVIETQQQLWIVAQMLGLAGMRSLEKLKGRA